MKPIEKTERYTLSKLVVQQLKQYILDFNLQPGQKLPAERKLSLDLKVSRAILRESLRSLESSGILELRHGEGAFITSQSLNPLLEQMSFAAKRSEGNVLELLTIRYMLEASAVDELFARGLSLPWKELERSISRMAEPSSLPEEEIQFHLMVIRSLGNVSLSQLAEMFVRQANMATTVTRSASMLAQAHGQYLDLLKQGDATQAKAHLRQLLGIA